MPERFAKNSIDTIATTPLQRRRFLQLLLASPLALLNIPALEAKQDWLFDKLVNFLKQYHPPVDYPALASSSQALIIGEWHQADRPRLELTRQFSALKEHGFDYLAMEMLPVAADPDLEEHKKTGGNISELRNLMIAQGWGLLERITPTWFSSVLSVVDAAQAAEIEVHGIDIASARFVDPDTRDEWMTDQVRQLLENADQKTIALVGLPHAQNGRGWLADKLQNDFTVTTTTLGLLKEQEEYFFSAIKEAGLLETQFMIPTLFCNANSLFPWDWLVHTP